MFTNLLEAFGTLFDNYIKVLKINLAEDCFEIIKLHPTEKSNDDSISFSKWMLDFAESGNIFPEDIDYYKLSLRINSIREYFNDKNNNCMVIKYRRKVDDEFRWVSTELLRAKEYSSNNQVIFLLIRDIHEAYINELQSLRELEHYCNYDTLTDLKNFHSYKNLCKKYSSSSNEPIGVIFSDVNGLKIINDTQGHEAGNNLLCSYSVMLTDYFKNNHVFRISGDEFVVVFIGITEEAMETNANKLINIVKKAEIPIASIGYAWKESPDSLISVSKLAEANMYLDKQAFYNQHPEYSRNKAVTLYNGNLERAIMEITKVFPTVGIANLLEDSYRMIRMDAAVGDPIIAPTYSEYLRKFMDMYVDNESCQIIEKFVGITKLQKSLENQESLTITFKTKDKHWRQITFLVIELNSDKEIKRILFFAHEMNTYVTNNFNDIYISYD